jgi:hypothetical protein
VKGFFLEGNGTQILRFIFFFQSNFITLIVIFGWVEVHENISTYWMFWIYKDSARYWECVRTSTHPWCEQIISVKQRLSRCLIAYCLDVFFGVILNQILKF